MNKNYWYMERERINKILDDKPSIMEFFSIGIFDFTFKDGALNIGFIDYDYLVDLIYKHKVSYEFDLFVSNFHKEINNFLYKGFKRQTIYEIKYAYDKLFTEIVATSGNLSKVIEEFQKFVEENDLMINRNVVSS